MDNNIPQIRAAAQYEARAQQPYTYYSTGFCNAVVDAIARICYWIMNYCFSVSFQEMLEQGRVFLIRGALVAGVNPEKKLGNDSLPMYTAYQNQQFNTVFYLLSQGVSPKTGVNGATIVDLAIQHAKNVQPLLRASLDEFATTAVQQYGNKMNLFATTHQPLTASIQAGLAKLPEELLQVEPDVCALFQSCVEENRMADYLALLRYEATRQQILDELPDMLDEYLQNQNDAACTLLLDLDDAFDRVYPKKPLLLHELVQHDCTDALSNVLRRGKYALYETNQERKTALELAFDKYNQAEENSALKERYKNVISQFLHAGHETLHVFYEYLKLGNDNICNELLAFDPTLAKLVKDANDPRLSLQAFAEKGYPFTLSTLLGSGFFDVHEKNNAGETALFVALTKAQKTANNPDLQKTYLLTVEALLIHGAGDEPRLPNLFNDKTAKKASEQLRDDCPDILFRAAAQKNQRTFEFLLQKGETKELSLTTAFYLIANSLQDPSRNQQFEKIALGLIRMGAHNAVEPQYGSLLHLAAAIDGFSPKILDALIKKSTKEQLLLQNKHGETALHTAVLSGNFAAIEALTQAAGKEIVLKADNAKRTPLHMAAQMREPQLFLMLVCSYLPKGQSQEQIQQMLKPILNAKDKYGMTPLQLVKDRDDQVLKEYLETFGYKI